MKMIKGKIDNIVAFVTCALLSVMVLITLWQVFTRYVLDSPSTTSEEFLRYALIWVSLLGAVYIFGKKAHIAITFFKGKLPDKAVLIVNVFIEALIIVFAGFILVYGGLDGVMRTMNQQSPAMGIPVGYVYSVLPLSGVLIIFYSTFNLIELLRNKKETEDIEEVKTEKIPM